MLISHSLKGIHLLPQWVGFEGFHMTVNGRHETPFAYREVRYELVDNIRLLLLKHPSFVLSALAKGLPVSEDHDLVADVEKLKAPPLLKKRLLMLVGDFSTGNNFERTMALRRTWMQYEAVRSGDVAVRFFIGLHKNSQINFELWREAQAYGDNQNFCFNCTVLLFSYCFLQCSSVWIKLTFYTIILLSLESWSAGSGFLMMKEDSRVSIKLTSSPSNVAQPHTFAIFFCLWVPNYRERL